MFRTYPRQTKRVRLRNFCIYRAYRLQANSYTKSALVGSLAKGIPSEAFFFHILVLNWLQLPTRRFQRRVVTRKSKLVIAISQPHPKNLSLSGSGPYTSCQAAPSILSGIFFFNSLRNCRRFLWLDLIGYHNRNNSVNSKFVNQRDYTSTSFSRLSSKAKACKSLGYHFILPTINVPTASDRAGLCEFSCF